MTQSIVVSQGKSFTVELQSMYGSTPYGWRLSNLPKGIILLGTENVKAQSVYEIGPMNQMFYFAAVSGDLVMTLEFVLAAAFCPGDIKDTYTVEVQVVPENPQQYVPYSENAVGAVKYGYMCDGTETGTVTDYGSICQEQDNQAYVKYGYPCAEQPNFKYGYPCGYNDAVDEANKPFIRRGSTSVDKPFIRRGSKPVDKPFIRRGCAPTDKPFIRGGGISASDYEAMKLINPYGMVYVNDNLHKYGFPNCE